MKKVIILKKNSGYKFGCVRIVYDISCLNDHHSMGRYKEKINLYFNHKHYFLGCMIFINIRTLHISSCFLIHIFLSLNPGLKVFCVFSSFPSLRTKKYESEEQ